MTATAAVTRLSLAVQRAVGTSAADLSQLSHRLTGRRWTRADSLDIQWTLTCSYGFWSTGRKCFIDLRI